MGITAEEFKAEILKFGILEPNPIHFELAHGRHGRKLEFDKIPHGSPAFDYWIEINAEKIYEQYIQENLGRTAVVSVAEGTDGIVKPIAETVGRGLVSLLTEHDVNSTVKLAPEAIETLKKRKIELAIFCEDVGTTGGTTLSGMISAASAGIPRSEAIVTWQRRKRLY